MDPDQPPPGSNIPPGLWQRLPSDDQEVIWRQYVHAGPTPGCETPGPEEPTTEPTNPALAEYLARHPEIETHQHFLMSFATDGVIDWQAFYGSCADLEIRPEDILNYRQAAMHDLAYPPQLHEGLPATAEDARRFHIVQLTDVNYNQDGPASSNNCGPASLAMTLDTLGLLPPGLSAEQKVDHARALMMGTHSEQIVIDGQTINLLDDDGELTSPTEIEHGAQAAGLDDVERQSGWHELNEALENGHPVVAFGAVYPGWVQEFDEFEGVHAGGEVEHFVAVLGRTVDGAYIVSDPLFRGGPVEMTREQLSVFFNRGVETPPYNDPVFVGQVPRPEADAATNATEPGAPSSRPEME